MAEQVTIAQLATTAAIEAAVARAQDAAMVAEGVAAVTVDDADVIGDNLVVTRTNGTTKVAGNVRGPQGLPGPGAVNNDDATKALNDTKTTKTYGSLARTFSRTKGVPVDVFLTDSERADGRLVDDGTADLSWLGTRGFNEINRNFGVQQLEWPPGKFLMLNEIPYASTRPDIGFRGAGSDRTEFVLGPSVISLVEGYGTSLGDTPRMFRNLLFEGFTINAYQQTTDPNTSMKGIILGHVRDSLFRDIVINGPHATAFGVDFLINVGFEYCYGLDAGRGLHTDTVLGSGSTFGIGVGAYPNEYFWFDHCGSKNARRMGWNFEWLAAYGLADYSTVIHMDNFTSDGDAVGVGDLGATGLSAYNGLIEHSTASGWVIGSGGQALKGGRGGYVDPSVVIQNAAPTAASFKDQDVYGGHGLTLRGDGGGRYDFQATIQDNAGQAIDVQPGTRLTPGGIHLAPRARRNGKGGLRWVQGGQTETGVVIEGIWEDNNGVAVDISSAMLGARVNARFINKSGTQPTPVKVDPTIQQKELTVTGTSLGAVGDLVLNGSSVVSPHYSLTNLDVPTGHDPAFLFFDTLKRYPTVTELGAGWYDAVGQNVRFTQSQVWEMGRDGAEPRNGGAGNSGDTARLRSTDDTGAPLPLGLRVSGIVDPTRTGAGRRGIIFSLSANAYMLLENYSNFYRWIEYDPSNPTGLVRKTTTLPYNERHHLAGVQLPTGNEFRVYIDGELVHTQSTALVPKTNVVGVYGNAQLDGWISNFKIESFTG